ncbi:helix-turn-helix domain-containing protein [Streptomyces sp. NPDC050619]|uniref:helix-turn-helix domain-containing protein n=1 Tax=Streptomyces sp. NPDC050619 TaxID=3157214 RepID=UPI00344600CD
MSGEQPLRVMDLVRRTALGLSVVVDVRRLNAEVRRAYVTDLPDPGRYLQPGDLVLTSGTWHTGPGDCERFVASLSEHGAVALVVGLLVLGTMPQELIEACAESGLQLLTIAPDRSFAPVIEAVTLHHLVEPTAAVRRAAAFHQRLVETVSRARGMRGILEVFHDEYGVDCWVLSAAGAVLTSVGEPPSAEEMFAVWSHALAAGGSAEVLTPLAGRPLAMTPVRSPYAASGIQGVLACRVGGPAARPVPPEPVRTVLGLLAMELDMLAAQRDTEQARVGELIDVLGSDAAAPGEVSAHLRLIGADPRLPTAIVVAELDGSDVRARAMAAVFGEALAAPGRGVAGELVLVVNGEGARPDVLTDAVRQVAERYQPLLQRGRLLVGISEPATSVSQLASSLDVARRRLKAARRGTGPVSVVSATDADTHLVLLASLPERLRESYRDRLLAPLLAYDETRGTQLHRTLASFLETCGSWQRSAEELHIHVNTLRYRVQRIEELTGRDLSSMRDRTDLYLALELLPDTAAAPDGGTPGVTPAVLPRRDGHG